MMKKKWWISLLALLTSACTVFGVACGDNSTGNENLGDNSTGNENLGDDGTGNENLGDNSTGNENLGDGEKEETPSIYDGEMNDGPVVLTLNALDTLSSATAVSGASAAAYLDTYVKAQGEASFQVQYAKKLQVNIPMRRNGEPLTKEKLSIYDEVRLSVFVPADSTYAGIKPTVKIGRKTFKPSDLKDGWNELSLDVNTLIQDGFTSSITVEVSQAKTGEYRVGFDELAGVYNEKLDLGNVMIFGDSYSTFEGYIRDPRFYYYAEKPVATTDVTRVEETWWGQVLSNTDNKLIMNDSISGATVCGTTYKSTAAPQDSFVERMDMLTEEGYFAENTVDTIFLFGGTNDSWGCSPLGEAKYEDWTAEDKNEVLPSFCYFIDKALKQAPNAQIVVVLNTYENLRDSLIAYYKPNPIDYQTPIIDAVKGFEEYGERIHIVALSDHENNNINLLGLHPTVSGGDAIKDQVLNILYERDRLDKQYWTTPDLPTYKEEEIKTTEDVLKDCESKVGFEWAGVIDTEVSTTNVVQGEYSVKGTLENDWSTWLIYLMRRGNVATLAQMSAYEYIELTVTCESAGKFYMQGVEIQALVAGENIVRIDGDRFVEIAQSCAQAGSVAYNEQDGYVVFNIAGEVNSKVWIDNIRGVYPTD